MSTLTSTAQLALPLPLPQQQRRYRRAVRRPQRIDAWGLTIHQLLVCLRDFQLERTAYGHLTVPSTLRPFWIIADHINQQDPVIASRLMTALLLAGLPEGQGVQL